MDFEDLYPERRGNIINPTVLERAAGMKQTEQYYAYDDKVQVNLSVILHDYLGPNTKKTMATRTQEDFL